MATKDHISGWQFKVSPEEIVEKTRKGGFTVDPKTGASPTTGTMVSIPGHEVPVPMEKFGAKDVAEYVTPERAKIISKPEMHLGTWRSSADPSIGDAAYLDVSKRFPDTPTGSVEARKAAISGDQWALYNIDRNMFESNIAKPEVRESITESKKVTFEPEEVERYTTSDAPVGQHLAFGVRTEPDVIRLPSGRRKRVAGPGQMMIVELGSKPQGD